MNPTFAAIALAAGIALGGLAHAESATQALELKGLRLGMTAEEVKALYPQATCEQMAEGLERCSDPEATINDRKSHLDIYFLDGTLLSVSYQRLLTRHAQDIGDLLAAKFGPPTYRAMETAWHLGSDSQDRRPRSTWDREGEQLQVIPFALHDRKADNTYSTVRLIHATRWDGEWLPRLRAGEHAKKTAGLDVSKADI